VLFVPMELKNLVKNLLSEINKISRSEAVVGGVRDAGKAKVIPLSRITVGFGTAVGGADGKSTSETREGDAAGQGGGAGGALRVEPRAFVVVGEDGVPHMLALTRGHAVVRRGIELTKDTEEVAKLPSAAPAPRLSAGKGAKEAP
jgi:uncharacterized spore protein YtfJ